MNKDFFKGGCWSFLFYFFYKNRWTFISMAIAMSIYALCHASYPYVTGHLIDSMIDHSSHKLVMGACLVSGLWLLMEVATRLLGVFSVRTFPHYRAQIQEEIYDHLKNYSQDFFNNHLAGSISNKIVDIAKSSEKIMEITIIGFIGPLISFAIYLITLYSIGYVFPICLLALIVFHITITACMYRPINSSIKEFSEASFSLSGYLVDYLTNVFIVKTYDRGAHEKTFFNHCQKNEVLKYHKFLRITEIMNFLKSGASFIFIGSVFWILVYTVSKDLLTVGDLSSLFLISLNSVTLSWRTSKEIEKILLEIGIVRSVLGSFSHVPITSKESLSSSHLQLVVRGKITFHNVSFSYPGSNPVFNKFNLTIHPGEKVGIIGYSGAGKSTLFKLILQSCLPQNGGIFIDDQDLRDISCKSLREQITFIPQDPFLFHRSIFENILYGQPMATADDVIQAAQLARCAEFIMALPEGYNSIVGERGLKLSNGQRQRIAIARAILKNSSLWLIDEATSSLDIENEFFLQKALAPIFIDKTIITIAHRFSTLKNMERIIMLEDGKIVADGPFETFQKKHIDGGTFSFSY